VNSSTRPVVGILRCAQPKENVNCAFYCRVYLFEGRLFLNMDFKFMT
jgi:hypothetical protein